MRHVSSIYETWLIRESKMCYIFENTKHVFSDYIYINQAELASSELNNNSVTWRIHTCTVTYSSACDTSHSYEKAVMWWICDDDGSFIYGKRLVHTPSIYKEWLTHTYFLIGSSHVICVDDDSSINEKWLDHVWEITQLYMWKDSSICENDSFICVPWRIRTCVTRLNHTWKFITWYVTMMTHPYMKNVSSIFGKVLVRMYVYSDECVRVWHDTIICGKVARGMCRWWLFHMWEMTHSYMRIDPSINEKWLIRMSKVSCDIWRWWLFHM